MDSHVIHQNRIRQILLLVVIALLGILLFRELYFFLPALLGAVTLYMVMRKLMFYLTIKRKWRKVWAALLLMFVSMIIIMFPIGILINMLSSKVSYVIDHSNEMIESLKKVVATIELRFNFQLVSEENLNKLGSLLAKGLPKLLSATFNTLGTIFFMYFLLYFMFINAKSMEKDLYEHVPLKDENVDKLSYEMHNMVISNAIGIPVIALLQGIVALIGYFIVGVSEPWFWFVVTCITAMLPIVGAALAYVPLAIIFLPIVRIGKGYFCSFMVLE